MYDVRALNELVAKESAFVETIMNEVGQGHRRPDAT